MTEKKILNYSRVRDVKQIERGTTASAGIDFFVPEFTNEFQHDFAAKNPCISELRPENYSYLFLTYPDLKSIFLAPHERLMIPSGIKIHGHEHKAIIIFNKSGIGVKKGLDVLACVIDEDYQGELHVSIVNTSNYIVEIKEGEKIVQGVELLVDYSELEEIDEKDLFETKTERGDKGFGEGTGTK